MSGSLAPLPQSGPSFLGGRRAGEETGCARGIAVCHFVLESDHVASDANERDGAVGQVERSISTTQKRQRKIPPSVLHVIRNVA
jgi:hypothetical protein